MKLVSSLVLILFLVLVSGHMHHNLEPKEELLFSPQIWTNAITATLLISAAPIFILLLIPVHNAAQNKPLLNILLAFAMGGLLGDVFLHLLPHSFDSHSHDHQHHHEHHEHHHEHHEHHDDHHEHSDHHHHHEEHEDHSHSTEGIMTGVWIIVGIFAFLIVEKSLRQLAGGHGHSHAAPKPHDKPKPAKKDSPKGELRNRKKSNGVEEKIMELLPEEHHHVSKVSGFLNLAADFTHNFTDGLAIGATFVAGERMGMITTFAILLHEVPHEIGDFAILVHSGFTKWQAMKLQFLTAIGALLGTAVGIMTGGLASATNVILPVTAGGFIYISTVSVIPELLDDCTSGIQTCLEILAACIGVGFMAVIAILE